MQKTIWITWENQRRSVELSQALDVPFFMLTSNSSRLMRYLILGGKTTRLLLAERPSQVIVQNPSIILACLVCLLKKPLGFRVVVDRHSNFKLMTLNSTKLVHKAFHWLSRYSVRHADLTIVTNEFLRRVLEGWGGTGFVLQDKFPSLTHASKVPLRGRYNCVFICSFSSEDEPVMEVIKAAGRLSEDTIIYITGNYRKMAALDEKLIPANICLTGFLAEKDFQSLAESCDVVIALTTLEHTLLCAAYEAVSLSKPLVLSNKKELSEYFYKGRVLTDNSAVDIAYAIKAALERKEMLVQEAIDLKEERSVEWSQRFAKLRSLLFE